MARFSERMGLRPVREVIQREAVDSATRNRLWDVVWTSLPGGESTYIEFHAQRDFYYSTWIDFFEEPADKIPRFNTEVHARLRKLFFEGSWHDLYDVLEYATQNAGSRRHRATKFANEVLQDFLCAYRFVGGELVEITSETDIASVETALTHPLIGVRAHLGKSLGLLGDRAKPDAANSIKEAVSAVESLCSALVGRKATLGDALKKLEEAEVTLHPALKKAWLSLYGWTSDADGIRHAMQGSADLTLDDAAYMLVSCSAFTSLLTEKALKAGIELTPVQ